MSKSMPIYAVQWFKDDTWKSLFISSWLPDAEATYRDLDAIAPKTPIRLVRFLVDNFDFVAIYGTDFAVVESKRV